MKKKIILGSIFAILIIGILFLTLPPNSMARLQGFYFSHNPPNETSQSRVLCCDLCGHYLLEKDFVRYDLLTDGTYWGIYICPVCGYSNDPKLSKYDPTKNYREAR